MRRGTCGTFVTRILRRVTCGTRILRKSTFGTRILRLCPCGTFDTRFIRSFVLRSETSDDHLNLDARRTKRSNQLSVAMVTLQTCPFFVKSNKCENRLRGNDAVKTMPYVTLRYFALRCLCTVNSDDLRAAGQLTLGGLENVTVVLILYNFLRLIIFLNENSTCSQAVCQPFKYISLSVLGWLTGIQHRALDVAGRIKESSRGGTLRVPFSYSVP